MSDLVIRPAQAGDLAAAAAVYAAVDTEIDRRTHPLSGLATVDAATKQAEALRDLQMLHEENPHQVWVAARKTVIGIAAAVIRGRHWHLTYLFVTPEAQERGIGGELLRRIHDVGCQAGCDVFTLQASDDPRALTRYFRLGLYPQPSPCVWTTENPHFPELGLDYPLEAHPLHLDDVATLNTVDDIDKSVRGVRRPQDVRRWLQEGAVGALLTDRATGRPAGYYLIANSEQPGRLGPIAAIDETRFADFLRAAFAAAAPLHATRQTWTVVSPGENHAAIAPLLAAGFRPSYTVDQFASGPIGQFDRYLFHDLDVL